MGTMNKFFPSMKFTTAQKMKFPIKDFFSKYDQIFRKLWNSSHLLKKFFMETFIFCAVVNFRKNAAQSLSN